MSKTILSLAAAVIFTAVLGASANAMDIVPVCSEDGCTLGLDVGPAVLVDSED